MNEQEKQELQGDLDEIQERLAYLRQLGRPLNDIDGRCLNLCDRTIDEIRRVSKSVLEELRQKCRYEDPLTCRAVYDASVLNAWVEKEEQERKEAIRRGVTSFSMLPEKINLQEPSRRRR